MQPIRFTRAERRSLRRLANANGRLRHGELDPDHARKFAAHRLLYVSRDAYHLSVTGQIEAVRQHFLLMPWRARPVRFTPPPPSVERRVRLPAFLETAARLEPVGEEAVAEGAY